MKYMIFQLSPRSSKMQSRSLIFLLTLLAFLFPGRTLSAGPYLNSAHGNTSYGANRASTATLGYVRANCAHCHEQHNSIAGSEPAPAGGSPSPFVLFADNFSSVQLRPYNQADNFCFYCHINVGAVQTEGGITNKQYSNTFGGYTTDSATDIHGAFNLSSSYHNLYDIQRFAKTKFAFFKDASNPCVACHNPHLAKRNKAHPADPTYTAISRPTDHENLWGDDSNERMNNYISYRPPYSFGSTVTYEPNNSALHNGSLMPDYNAFCLDCHQYQVPTTQSVSKNPDTPAGYLTAIDWSASGDMHGERARLFNVDGSDNTIPRTDPSKPPGSILGPYNAVPVQSNYVLSCMDCHEAHGTYFNSSYLLRREVNNDVVEGSGPLGGQVVYQQRFCERCHTCNHCGGSNGCFPCHYHGAENKGCAEPWTGPNF